MGAIVKPDSTEGVLQGNSEWWLDTLATVVLLVGSLFTAMCALEAARWGSVQSQSYADASARRVQATALRTRAAESTLFDALAFDEWADAWMAADDHAMAFYRSRFRPEFETAFQAWFALNPASTPDAPPGPMWMEEYVNAEQVQAEELELQASAALDGGNEANLISTRFTTFGFFGALAIFLAGVMPRFPARPLRWTVIAIAAVLLLWGASNAVVLPLN